MAPSNIGSAGRRERILDAAARAFAANGYRGTGLRDIALDAGCSLTLLNHHFGSKSMLLGAVVHGQQANCLKRMAVLASANDAVNPPLELSGFVTRWANYEFDLHATRDGRQYLLLMLRLAADGAVDEELRRTLNCSEPIVIRAFGRARPLVALAARTEGWRLASAALYAAVIRTGESESSVTDGARRQTVDFVVGGLDAYWANGH